MKRRRRWYIPLPPSRPAYIGHLAVRWRGCRWFVTLVEADGSETGVVSELGRYRTYREAVSAVGEHARALEAECILEAP